MNRTYTQSLSQCYCSVVPLVAYKKYNRNFARKSSGYNWQTIYGRRYHFFDGSKDSSSYGYTVANDKGIFEMKGIEEGRYRLLITFGGYDNVSRIFSITKEKNIIDVGTIFMERRSTTLQEVIIERPPISIKKDTVEYNASSFKTKPNEDVEGLT